VRWSFDQAFPDQELLDAIHQALDRDRAMRQRYGKLAELRKRYATLTAREREVPGPGSLGMLNKQIALNSAPAKSRQDSSWPRDAQDAAESLAELVRMAADLELLAGKKYFPGSYTNV